MKSTTLRGVLMAGAATVSLVLGGQTAGAAEPSNQELYKMLKDLEQKQQQLIEENATLKRQADEVELGTQPSQTAVTLATGGPRFSFDLEALALKPVNDQLGYAISTPDVSLPGTPEEGSVLETIDPDYSPGFRAGFTMAIGGSGMDVRIGGAYLSRETSAAVTEPAGGELYATRSPGNSSDHFADSASAMYELDHFAVDVEVGQNLKLGASGHLRLFGGIRYASVETKMNTTYVGGDFSASGDTVAETSKMSGIGPRFGMDVGWSLGAGFRLGGAIAGSLLMGAMDASYGYTDNGFPTDNAYVSESDTGQVFPALESKLALGWGRKLGARFGLGVEAGYRFEQWFGVQNTFTFPDDITDTILVTERSDIGMHGPYLNVKMTF